VVVHSDIDSAKGLIPFDSLFSADVAGYGRLMQDDEAATVKTLKA